MIAAVLNRSRARRGAHSLGAAHAVLYAAHRAKMGKPPYSVVVFGEPKAGFSQLSDILKGVVIRSYRNATQYGHDIVTDVPLSAGTNLAYVHPRPLIDVSAQPAIAEAIDLAQRAFAFHHMKLYVDGLSKLPGMKAGP